MSGLLRSSWWIAYDEWPLDRVEAFDRACDQIEREWSRGTAPDTEPLLRDLPAQEHATWLAEFLAIEIETRWSRQEPLVLDEFLTRFPASAETVRQAWQETAPLLRTLVPCDVQTAETEISGGEIGGRAFQPGFLLDGRYRIEGLRGAGGMGELYRARRLAGDLPVAVKVLMPPASGTSRNEDWFQKRFAKEMRILQHLRHPHLITALDYVESADHPPVIVMDWVEGRSLSGELERRGAMPWHVASEVARQAGEALGYAWERFQLVHRDIKPSNIMLTPDGRAAVLDFGLARAPAVASQAANDETSVREQFGTPDFSAPEQWESARDVGPMADVYALGATLYYLLTGEAPYAAPGMTGAQRIRAHLIDPVPDVRVKCPAVPAGLAALLTEMLAKDPRERPHDCGRVAARLASWGDAAALRQWAETGTAAEPSPPAVGGGDGDRGGGIALPLSRRSLLMAGGAAALGLGVLGIAAWFGPDPDIVEFRVTVFERLPGGTFRTMGEIGRTLASVPAGGEVRISARLRSAAYVQLIEAHPDGTIRPLLDDNPGKRPDQETISGRTSVVEFPRQDHYRLDETPGLQAFILLASRRPLPPVAGWQNAAAFKEAWSPSPDQAGVWRNGAERIEPLPVDDDEVPRGQLVAAAPEAVVRLVRSLRDVLGPQVHVSLLAFPVREA